MPFFNLESNPYMTYTSHMQTISVSQLKAHLSAAIRQVETGENLTILDHHRPVARLSAIQSESLVAKSASGTYHVKELPPLIAIDALELLEADREDR